MKPILIPALLLGLAACRQPQISAPASFEAYYSPGIQAEIRTLVLRSHNAFHTGCLAQAGSLSPIGFRILLEDSSPVGLVRWKVLGECPVPFYYETRTERIRRHPDLFEKNYGISIEPIYEAPEAFRSGEAPVRAPDRSSHSLPVGDPPWVVCRPSPQPDHPTPGGSHEDGDRLLRAAAHTRPRLPYAPGAAGGL